MLTDIIVIDHRNSTKTMIPENGWDEPLLNKNKSKAIRVPIKPAADRKKSKCTGKSENENIPLKNTCNAFLPKRDILDFPTVRGCKS